MVPNGTSFLFLCNATASLLLVQVVDKGWSELLGEPQTS